MPNLFVFCPRLSTGATNLAVALGARRLRHFDGLNFRSKGSIIEIPPDSVIVNWGGTLPDLDDARVLNHTPAAPTRYSDMWSWRNFGVRTPPMWVGSNNPNSRYGSESKWIPRREIHTPCQDLLSPPTGHPRYWTSIIPITKEYLVHIFNSRTVRSSEKVPRPGYQVAATHAEWLERRSLEKVAHPWWRHFDTGWTTIPATLPLDPAIRRCAIAAVKALVLTFGCIDIGVTAEDVPHVFGISRAPHLDEPTLAQYARLIRKWIDAPAKVEEEDTPHTEDIAATVEAPPANDNWFVPAAAAPPPRVVNWNDNEMIVPAHPRNLAPVAPGVLTPAGEAVLARYRVHQAARHAHLENLRRLDGIAHFYMDPETGPVPLPPPPPDEPEHGL